jgi:hypothetical protein
VLREEWKHVKGDASILSRQQCMHHPNGNLGALPQL